MAVGRDTRRWIRKVDGDMHIVAEQPVVRLYPTTLDEVVESVREARDSPGNSEARAIGSHWAMWVANSQSSGNRGLEQSAAMLPPSVTVK